MGRKATAWAWGEDAMTTGRATIGTVCSLVIPVVPKMIDTSDTRRVAQAYMVESFLKAISKVTRSVVVVVKNVKGSINQSNFVNAIEKTEGDCRLLNRGETAW
jgi:hypothetical protein